MKLQAISRPCEIEESKLLGDAYLPESWLEEGIFSPYEFFIAQINLQHFDCEILPKSGYLYFFLDAISLKEDKIKAKVRYFNGEPDAYTDFNEGYFEEDMQIFSLAKSDIGSIDFECENGEEVCLLKVPTNLIPAFEFESSSLVFSAKRKEIEKLDFSQATIKFIK